MSTTRRTFLMAGGAVIAGAAAGLGENSAARADEKEGAVKLETPESVRRGDMLYRQLGSTGQEVSLIGMGGFHLGQKQVSEEESIRLIRSGIDRGITFLDNSWDYNDGQSEIRVGKAIKDGYRDKVIVMTKIDGRTKKEANRQIEQSLKRLGVQTIDLLQHHEVIRMEDPDRIFADGGAMEAFLDAKKAGKIRFIGFTGHKDPAIHLRMLEVADAHQFHFDTVQMPINVMDAQFRSFGHRVLPVLVEKKIGPLAMKTFGSGVIIREVLKDKSARPIEMLHYSMTQPVSVVITGIDKPEVLDQALEAARTFKPMEENAVAELLGRVRAVAVSGKTERFKVSQDFDSTAKRPEWLG
jgi:uncharacterized protein